MYKRQLFSCPQPACCGQKYEWSFSGNIPRSAGAEDVYKRQALAYVKSVSFANGVLTVTDQSGTPTTYTIPDNDTNTTYTLDVSQDGNKATITLTRCV